MTDTPDGLALDWLELPERLEQARLPMPAATADFLQVAQLANLLTSLFWGTNDFYVSPEDRLAGARSGDGHRTEYLVARLTDEAAVPGRIVGFARLGLPADPGERSAESWVGVHPDFRRRRVGSALLAETEAEAARCGRTELWARTDNVLVGPAAVGSGPVFVRGTSLDTGLTPVVPPAGQGPGPGDTVRRDAPDAAFAAAHGYGPARLDWCSVLDLRRAAGTALQAEAGSGPAGEDGYAIVEWVGPCPEEHAGALAELIGLDTEPGAWDRGRLRARERDREARGLQFVGTAAVDRSTGRLVGHSGIETAGDLPQAAYQGATIVRPEHRGRGLGLLLRAVAVSRLLRLRPEAERLYTWTPAEDEVLLRADEALGFVPVALRPEWRKRP